jgi:hypothetical protein
MRVIDAGRGPAEAIDRFESRDAWAHELAEGHGATHVYSVHIDAGGEIGPHEAGFDQLFIVVAGSGWGAGPDGVREALTAGQAALFRKGELHSKGSEEGLSAIMVQVDALNT